MCGRYLLISNPEAIRALFGYPEQPNFPPRYNIAPGQPVAIVRGGHGARQFALVRWGLLPAWVKDPRGFRPLVNVRSETVAQKPGFRGPFRHRRALVPADGWYEWQDAGGGPKRPFLVRPRDGAPLALAAICDHYLAPDGSEIETAALLTSDANAALSGVHHRMPVVVSPEAFALWLDPLAEERDLARLLRPAPDHLFEAVEVSTKVNAVANDDASVIAPAQPRREPEPRGPAAASPPAEERQLRLF